MSMIRRPDTAFGLDPYQKGGRVEDKAHLRFIRTMPCLRCFSGPPSEAAHIRYGDPSAGERRTGMGTKPDDRRTVPLCERCHRTGPMAQHKTKEATWWRSIGIEPMGVAAELYAATGNHDRARIIISAARLKGWP